MTKLALSSGEELADRGRIEFSRCDKFSKGPFLVQDEKRILFFFDMSGKPSSPLRKGLRSLCQPLPGV